MLAASSRQRAWTSCHSAARLAGSQHRHLSNYTRTALPLNNNQEIPALGFGTWQDKDAQEDAVYEALQAGYRHIDTARVYGTEPAVAKGMKRSGIPREDIFLTTKLWSSDTPEGHPVSMSRAFVESLPGIPSIYPDSSCLRANESRNNSHHPEDVEKACDASLNDLKTDYVDLFLIHWPGAFQRGDKLRPTSGGKVLAGDIDYVETWKAMEGLVKSGKTKAIGVSNFNKTELERLLARAEITPAAHQYECHPYLAQADFANWHKTKGIHVTHYSPFGNSNPVYDKGKNISALIDDPVLVEIGRKYSKSGAQVALAWGLRMADQSFPNPRLLPGKIIYAIKSNLEGDFNLDAEDVAKVDALDRKLRFNDPSKSFGYEFYMGLDGKE